MYYLVGTRKTTRKFLPSRMPTVVAKKFESGKNMTNSHFGRKKFQKRKPRKVCKHERKNKAIAKVSRVSSQEK